jgi:hypothetical protein
VTSPRRFPPLSPSRSTGFEPQLKTIPVQIRLAVCELPRSQSEFWCDDLDHWVWFERLERKWSISKYGGKGHWRVSLPVTGPLHIIRII